MDRYDWQKNKILKSKEIHGDRYDYSLVDYFTAHDKVKFICKIHGIFEQSFKHHFTTEGCKKCSNNTKSITKRHNECDFLNILMSRNDYYKEGKLKIISNYEGQAKKVKVLDEFGYCNILAQRLLENVKPNIGNAINKTDYYSQMLLKYNSQFKNNEFVIVSKYGYRTNKILVKDKYGELLADVNNLLRNHKLSISSAVNKTDYFKNMLLVNNKGYENNNFIVIGNYISGEKILIKDKYSEYLISTSNLLNNRNPTIISSTDKNLYTKNKLNEIHNYKYGYNNLIYNKRISIVDITCPIHGDFKQSLNDHYRGEGCVKCGRDSATKYISENSTGWGFSSWEKQAYQSKNFDSFKVYIIKCWNEKEEFYKIGRTFSTVKNRFLSKKSMPYKYKIINIFKDSALKVWNMERDLKNINKDYKYIPKIKFNGSQECYNFIENE